MKNDKTTRRKFLAQSAVAASGITLGLNSVAQPVSANVLGANDKIRVGFIGVGNRGSQLLQRFMGNEDVEVAALCDVYQPYTSRNRSEVASRYLEIGKIPKLGEKFPNKVQTYKDFRQMLDQKDIDAVVIATPDHWHAVQTINALEAGKDIYVEKPLTITLREGRMMIEAQQKTDRVVAVGLNRRGSTVYQNLAPQVQSGLVGPITSAQAFRISNMYPNGIGNLKPENPPADFDWDMWLGPRAYRPYQYNIAPYFFRWWDDYSSQMGNWGVHYMDVIRWMMGEEAPVAITAHGGKYVLSDDRTIPDTMDVIYEFASGAHVKFSIYEASGGRGVDWGEIELRGAKGNLYASQDGYKIAPARSGQFQDWKQLVKPQERMLESDAEFGDLGIKEDSTANLIRNFLDCVKSRETPWCTLEDGHRSTSFAHLGNIALAMGTRIEWDPKKEVVTNIKKANDLLHYEYRKPWSLT
ncbi:MAG: Gfo/Idh/MocA family protein [Candidatus Cyclobacteriaceae bacterium M3_2C_046]